MHSLYKIVKNGYATCTKFCKFNKKNYCRDTIFNDPIPVGQVLAQGVPHNEFRVEYGLKNLVSISLDGLLHEPWEYRNKNENSTVKRSPSQMIRLKISLIYTD